VSSKLFLQVPLLSLQMTKITTKLEFNSIVVVSNFIELKEVPIQLLQSLEEMLQVNYLVAQKLYTIS
jgi:hypothetical protein